MKDPVIDSISTTTELTTKVNQDDLVTFFDDITISLSYKTKSKSIGISISSSDLIGTRTATGGVNQNNVIISSKISDITNPY